MIAFQSGLTGTITLTTGEIDILEALDVQGPGSNAITVSGNNAFNPDTNGAAGDQVSISGLALTDGNAGVDNGGALYATLARLTLSNMAITSSEADTYGGACSRAIPRSTS